VDYTENTLAQGRGRFSVQSPQGNLDRSGAKPYLRSAIIPTRSPKRIEDGRYKRTVPVRYQEIKEVIRGGSGY
jgi:hypothetical protein